MRLARIGTLAGVAAAAVAALAFTSGNDDPPATSGVVLARRAEANVSATRPTKKSAAPSASFATPVRPLPDDYQPILQRSLFSSKRESPERDADLAEAKIAAAAARETSLVLCGVAQQGDAFTALVEDVAGHRVTRLSIGDTIGRGRLTRVDLDGVEYEVGGQVRRLRVGDDLTGAVAAIAEDASPKSAKVARAIVKKKSKPEEGEAALPAQPGEGSHAKNSERVKTPEPPKKKEKPLVELKLKGGASAILPNHID